MEPEIFIDHTNMTLLRTHDVVDSYQLTIEGRSALA